MPDARLHFRSPAWQSLPVAGLPPATSPESAAPTPAFFDCIGRTGGVGESMQSSTRRTPRSSAVVESTTRSIAPPDPSFSRNAEGSAAAHRARRGSLAGTGWRLATSSTLSARSGREDRRKRSDIGSLLPFEPCDSLRAEIPRHRISGDRNRDLRLSTRRSRKGRRGGSLLASRRAALARTSSLHLLRRGDARRLSRGARLTTEMRYSSCLPSSTFSAFALSR
jgi:hypothetical protein